MDWLGFTERQNNNVAKTRSSFLYTNPEHWMDARVPFTRTKAALNAKVLEISPIFGEKRFKSITLGNFNGLIRALITDPDFIKYNSHLRGDHKNITSREVMGYFIHENAHKHLHDKYEPFFSTDEPNVVLTYEWSIPLADVYKVLTDQKATLLYIYEKKKPDVSHLKNLPTVNIRIWIDILFNNQNSNNIQEELNMAEQIYKSAPYHVAIVTPTLFSRCWCLYEIAVRSIACSEKSGLNHTWFLPLDSDDKDHSFLNLEQIKTTYSFFDEMQAFDKKDIETVKGVILHKMENKNNFDKLIHDALKCVIGESFISIHQLAEFIAILSEKDIAKKR